MDRNELHEEYKKTVAKVLDKFISHIADSPTMERDVLIESFIEKHIRKEPNPDWNPPE
jgi:hypothetical protein